MNTRLSQRVYSEAALEFWLQRLEGDWEQQFSEAELAEGRRLYRQGAVRQLELGDTDAIVHMRVEGAEEAYVVLDWQGQKLSIRASVEDQAQRRLLAVTGLYEVEELVGDEASALAPDVAPQAKHTDGQADEASSVTADGADTPASSRTDVANTQNGRTGSGKLASGHRQDGGSTQTASGGVTGAGVGSNDANQLSGGKPAGSHGSGGNSDRAVSPTSAADAAPTASSFAKDGQPVSAQGQDDGQNAQPPVERRLELHFSLKQGLLLFRAGWRQKGRRRLVPALGETAPSAETMTADERETLIRLASLARRGGFRYDKAQGGYRMDSPERMEQFVGKELGGWSEFFDVTQEMDVALLSHGVQEVSLRARIGENSDGNLSLHWMAGFEQDLPGSEYMPAFTSAERRRLLRSGATPLLLPGRGLVRLSAKQAKASEQLSDAVSLFPGGTAPRYLLFSLTGLSDLPVEISASLQRWRQSVLGGNLEPKPRKKRTGGGAVATDAAASSVAAKAAKAVKADGAAAEDAGALPSFLRPYQRLGINWMRHLFERGCHGLLADEMGLGKTVQVLSLIATAPKWQSIVPEAVSAASDGTADSASTTAGNPAAAVSAAGNCSATAAAASNTSDDALVGGKPFGDGAAANQGDAAAKASLVVCPASVVPVWQAQAAQFFPHLKVRVLGAGSTFTTPSDEPVDLWLASYTQLRRHKSLLEQVQFARAVLDEAQVIKNPEAKVTQACLSIKADHRLALSGTPLENRYLDVWTLFRFLMPGLLGTRRRFEEALATDEAKHLATLRKQLAPFILRRTKSEVASELPDKVELDLYCPLSDMQRTEYRRLLTEGMELYAGSGKNQSDTAKAKTGGRQSALSQEVSAVGEGFAQSELAFSGETALDDTLGHDSSAESDVTAESAMAKASPAEDGQPGLMSVLTLLTRLRQVSCDPALLPWMHEAGLHHSGKLNLLRDRLGEVFANGKKAVVFSQFVKFLDRAKQAIAADYPDVPVYQLIGTTRDRTRPVERFQAQEGAGVMLVSLKAGGTGITLHAADYVFLLDPWWNPAVEAQAIDRVHRIGQVNRVFVYRMVTAETVEARIAALKQTKRERFEQIMSGASGGDDFREAFRSLESLLGLLKESDAPQAADASAEDADADASEPVGDISAAAVLPQAR